MRILNLYAVCIEKRGEIWENYELRLCALRESLRLGEKKIKKVDFPVFEVPLFDKIRKMENKIDLVDFDKNSDFYSMLNSIGEVVQIGNN